jgi:hypothetical protein
MYISYLNYPPLPLDLELDILNTIESHAYFQKNNLLVNADAATIDLLGETAYTADTNIGYHYSQARDHFPHLVDYYFLEASERVKDWVFTNISKDVTINIQVMTNGMYVPPHIDEVRTSAINYLISSADATTNFYEPKSEFAPLSVTAQTAIPHERLELKQSSKIAERTWHKLDVGKIHSVENIATDSKRISLTLSIV